MVDTMKFNSEVMKQHADNPNSAAIDLAEYLVAKGIPFREAHAIVGSHVAASIEEGTDLADIVSSDERLGPEAAALLAPGAAVNRRTSPGGAGPEAVKVQIKEFQIQLDSQRERLKSDI